MPTHDLRGALLTLDRFGADDFAAASIVFTAFDAPEATAARKAIGEEVPPGYVAGWASTSAVDSYGHIVEANAFAASIASRGLRGPRGVKILIGHSWDKTAGEIKVLEYRSGKLWIEAQLNLNISYARDAWEAAKSAGGLSFSVGFYIQDYEFRETEAGEDTLIVKRGDLFEVSVVPFPANEECGMEFVKSKSIEGADNLGTMSAFERALVDSGLVKSRNAAHRVVELVRRSAHLFKDAPPVEPSPPAPPASQVATALGTLTQQTVALRAALVALRAK